MRDFLIPGGLLFVVLGLGPLLALYGLVRKRGWARTASIAVGLGLVIWIAIQISMIGYASWLQPLYGVLGVVISMLALRLSKGGVV